MFSANNTISPTTAQKMKARINPVGTVIFPKIGGAIATNKRRILKKPSAIDNNCLGIVPGEGCWTEWLFLVLSAIDFTEFQSGTSVPALSQRVIGTIEVGLPPLEEQKRIVAKVDELMALCDDLETQQQTRAEARSRLNTIALGRLSSATDEPSFKRAWARVGSAFDTLYSTPETIGDLRKTILQLAVQGKLVRQDSSDEPAEKLLERVVDGNQRKSNLVQSNTIEEPYLLPRGWKWATFNQVGTIARGKSKHRPRNDPQLYENGTYPLIQTGDVARAKDGTVATYTGLYNEIGLAQSRLWLQGTLCITIAANIADTALLGFDACFPDSIVGFTPSETVKNTRYFDYFMRTAKERLQDYAPSTAQKNINLAILESVFIPIPPLNEMKRIVSKVDELMTLVDELEAGLLQARGDSERLLGAVIQSLLSSARRSLTGQLVREFLDEIELNLLRNSDSRSKASEQWAKLLSV